MFFVGADALIGPDADGIAAYVFSDRSGVVPSGTIWGSSPTVGKRTVFLYGTMALIGPDADGTDVSVFSDLSGDTPHGAMWASPPTIMGGSAF